MSFWTLSALVIGAQALGLVVAGSIAVHSRAKYMALRQEFDRQNEWLAYMANPREVSKPRPYDEPEPSYSFGKRDYEPNEDYGAVADLLGQIDEPPDFFELAPEAEEAEMINIANRQPQQVGMDEPEFEKKGE